MNYSFKFFGDADFGKPFQALQLLVIQNICVQDDTDACFILPLWDKINSRGACFLSFSSKKPSNVTLMVPEL